MGRALSMNDHKGWMHLRLVHGENFVTVLRLHFPHGVHLEELAGDRFRISRFNLASLASVPGEPTPLCRPAPSEGGALCIHTVSEGLLGGPSSYVEFGAVGNTTPHLCGGPNEECFLAVRGPLQFRFLARSAILPAPVVTFHLYLTFRDLQIQMVGPEAQARFAFRSFESSFGVIGTAQEIRDSTVDRLLRLESGNRWSQRITGGPLWRPALLTTKFRGFGLRGLPTLDNEWLVYFAELSPAVMRPDFGLGIAYRHGVREPIWPFGISIMPEYPDLELGALLGLPDVAYSLLAVQRSGAEMSPNSAQWQLRANCRTTAANDRSSTVTTPIRFWNDWVASSHLPSLERVKGGQPASVVPRFILEDASGGNRIWRVTYNAVDESPERLEVKDEHHRLCLAEVLLQDTAATKPSYNVELPNLHDHAGAPLRRRFHLEKSSTDPLSDETTGPRLRFGLTDVMQSEAELPAQITRIGALDLRFKKDPGFEAPPGNVEATGLRPLVFPEKLISVHRAFEISLVLPLLVDGFGPGSQDLGPLESSVEGEGRPPSIVFPAIQRAKDSEDRFVSAEGSLPFLLTAEERCGARLTHSLSFRLDNTGRSLPKPTDLIVIDQYPAMIARVRAELDLGSAGEVGNWSGDEPTGGSWELQETRDGFQVFLPPQCVGEEFIKKYPFDHRPLHFRFSPPAVLNLARTPHEQRFAEAPWNLRRLFGYPGQWPPGTSLRSAQTEFLYGLACHVDTPSLQLAEIESRLGRLASLLPPIGPIEIVTLSESKTGAAAASKEFHDKYASVRRSYLSQRGVFRSRLAVLEPDFLPGASVRTALAGDSEQRGVILSDSVSFSFRRTREVVHPITPERMDGPYVPYDPAAGRFGLRGGADWGFESQNIYDEVISSGSSSSGLLVRPTFSMLGGTAFQKASFARDKSSIYADVFLGRTFFYSIERIGRIAILWNRAKHVLVYERSVADSEQFPEPPPDPSGDYKWRGRPVGRKVAEYVQILEPDRPIPKPQTSENADPRSRSFVLASRFSEEPILVNGEWGRDVPGGWIIPLWRPGAPSPYNEPHVHLKLAAPRDSGCEHIFQPIENTEDLYFYTSTNPSLGSDTDTWPPVPLIDFPLVDVHQSPADVPAMAQEAPDGRLPDPPSVLPGYESFTFQLTGDGLAADLMAARSRNPVGAVIKNVALMRRGDVSIGVLGAAIQQRAELLSDIEGFSKKLGDASQKEVLTVIASIEVLVQKKLDGQLDRIRQQAIERILDPVQHFADGAVQFKRAVVRAVSATQEPPPEPPPEWPLDTLPAIRALQTRLKEEWLRAFGALRPEIYDRIRRELSMLGSSPTDDRLELAVRAVRSQLERFALQIQSAECALNGIAADLNRTMARLGQLNSEFEFLSAQVGRRIFEIGGAVTGLVPYEVAEAQRLMKRVALAVATELRTTAQKYRSSLGPVCGHIADLLDTRLLRVSDELLIAAEEALSALPEEIPLPPAIEEAVRILREGFVNRISEIVDDSIRGPLADAIRVLTLEIDRIQAGIIEALEIARLAPAAVNDLAVYLLANGVNALDDLLEPALARVNTFFDGCDRALQMDNLGAIIKEVRGAVDNVESRLNRAIGQAHSFARNWCDGLLSEDDLLRRELLSGEVARVIGAAYGVVEAAVAPYQRMISNGIRAFDEKKIFGPAIGSVQQLGSNTLRLASAFGKAPIAKATQFAREHLQYFPRQFEDVIDTTPVALLFNRLGKDFDQFSLKSLGLRCPIDGLTDLFRPIADLGQFDLPTILSEMAGAELAGLLKHIPFPNYARDGLKITKDLNPRTGEAWLQAVIDVKFRERLSLVNFGAVAVQLDRAQFYASTRISAGPNSPPQQQVEAFIRGDWILLIGGSRVMTLRDAILRVNSTGQVRFEISPSGVVLADALNFLSDLISRFQPADDSGLSMQIVQTAQGIPIGARAALDVKLPTIGAGAFSISGLALHTNFEIAIDPQLGFYIGAGLGIASKERPFNLTILFLGGGGWFGVETLYRPFGPARDRLMARLSIGIAAGASLVFDIGVASGGVYFLVYLNVEYTYSHGNNDLRITLGIVIHGEVRVLSIITVSLTLMFEASYESGGRMTCRGMLRLKIKICWCFSITVKKSVTIVLAGKSAEGQDSRFTLPGTGRRADGGMAAIPKLRPTASESVRAAVRDYIHSFGD